MVKMIIKFTLGIWLTINLTLLLLFIMDELTMPDRNVADCKIPMRNVEYLLPAKQAYCHMDSVIDWLGKEAK